MSKHTPGKWKLEIEKYEGEYCEEELDYVFVVGENGNVIAEVYPSQPEQKSNARLMRTAPDLLEALQEAVEWLENAPMSYANGNMHNGIDEGEVLGWRGHVSVVDKAKAAIAKAEASDED